MLGFDFRRQKVVTPAARAAAKREAEAAVEAFLAAGRKIVQLPPGEAIGHLPPKLEQLPEVQRKKLQGKHYLKRREHRHAHEQRAKMAKLLKAGYHEATVAKMVGVSRATVLRFKRVAGEYLK